MRIIRLLQQMYYICMATTQMKIEYNAVTLNMLSYNQIYVHQHSSASIIRDTFHWPKIWNKQSYRMFILFCMTVFTQHKIWDSFVWLPKYFDLLLNSIWMVEKAMAPHSSTPAWKIPWTEEPGRLQSMGSLRVGHDWATSLSLSTFMHGRRKWQPTPVFAWRIPGTGEPCGLPSMGSHRVGHDWSDLAAAAAAVFEWMNIWKYAYPVIYWWNWVVIFFFLWLMLLWIFTYD